MKQKINTGKHMEFQISRGSNRAVAAAGEAISAAASAGHVWRKAAQPPGYGRINVPPVAMPVAVRKALLALGESRVDLATALTRHGVRAVVTV